METSQLGKWLVIIGIGILLLGVLFILASKMGVHFGKLHGDVTVEREKFSLYFPITTSIIASILLTLFLNILFYLLRK